MCKSIEIINENASKMYEAVTLAAVQVTQLIIDTLHKHGTNIPTTCINKMHYYALYLCYLLQITIDTLQKLKTDNNV